MRLLVSRMLWLVAREGELRERARTLELDPGRYEEAVRLFRSASRLRDERLGLARECGLL